MFDLKFYNQLFDCLRSLLTEWNNISSIILTINSRCQIKNASNLIE